MAENGWGNGGGNSSVWWELRHGSERRKQQLEMVGYEPQTAAPAQAPAETGRRRRPRRGLYDRPGPGQVRLSCDDKQTQSCLEIHDRTSFPDIGRPDHPGMFRVRLRIKKAEMDALIAAEKNARRRRRLEKYRKELPKLAKALQALTGRPPFAKGERRLRGDVYLVVDVPAIERKPGEGQPWPHMPWEIYWQW